MIIKKEYKNSKNVIRYTTIDNIERIDSGRFDDGTEFINIYRKDRKYDDEFETIRIESIVVFIMSDTGKTLQILRP